MDIAHNAEWYGRWPIPAIWPEKGEDEKKRLRRDTNIAEKKVLLDKELRKLSIRLSQCRRVKPDPSNPVKTAKNVHELVEVLNDINTKTEELAKLALQEE
jgi:hypothetical protein